MRLTWIVAAALLALPLPQWSQAADPVSAESSAAKPATGPASEATTAPTVKPAAAEAKPAETAKAEQPEEQKFIRCSRDGKPKKIQTLETAIVRYVSGDGGATDVESAKTAEMVNKTDSKGNTPLHLAAEEGQLDVVKQLLANGARIDVENKEGLTPLHLAAQKGQKEIVALLIAEQKKPSAVTVDLIGVVHIGEKEYYEQLNQIFKDYDAVLYELVAPPNTRVPKDARNRTPGSMVGMAQSGMKDVLKLDFQLHYIDYHVANLVHADMSPEQFEKSMADRGESFFQMMLNAMGQSMAQQTKKPGGNDLNMLMAMFSTDRSTALKRAMAEQFEDLDSQMELFGGKDGSTIITERNKVCLEVLSKEIAAGKKKIAIFYGAGHMPDMAGRLLKDFGLHRVGERWLVAWDMRDAKSKGKPASESKTEAAPKKSAPAEKTAEPATK